MRKLLFITLLFTSYCPQAQNFTPTDAGSKLHFVIKNIGINTGGDIAGMKGKITFDAKKPSSSSFDVTVAVSTLDTDNGKRDGHLKSNDYFDVQKYPSIHLVSTELKPGIDLKHFIFKGNLTIKNVTRPVEFPFTAEGKNGGALFAGQFQISRIDFGVGKESVALANKVIIKLSAFAKAN
ncbi:MAG: YceI family protein [Ferruginibacter sp.]